MDDQGACRKRQRKCKHFPNRGFESGLSGHNKKDIRKVCLFCWWTIRDSNPEQKAKNGAKTQKNR